MACRAVLIGGYSRIDEQGTVSDVQHKTEGIGVGMAGLVRGGDGTYVEDAFVLWTGV
jgi:hypothetical protein